MVQNIVRPFRELFVMLFFVSMGTLVDVSTVALNWRVLVAVAIVTIVVRWVLWAGVGRVVRLASGSAAAFGIALLPMGEFNIVLGNASFAAGRVNRSELALLVGASMISILASAVAARLADKRLARIGRMGPSVQPISRGAPVVVIGYGRVGRTAVSMLQQRNVDVVIVEHDPALVRSAQSAGLEAVYGDGGDPHLLDRVISPQTRVVLTSVPDSATNAAIARWLRARSVPAIVARSERPADVPRLLDAGAAAALVPEVEGARAFGRAVLSALSKDDVLPEPQL
jgi:CPA2 family monovalent cation:H+ antiporter-2